MKTHPVLFNGEMVRAILSGRKTQTRRVMKHIPTEAGWEAARQSITADRNHEIYGTSEIKIGDRVTPFLCLQYQDSIGLCSAFHQPNIYCPWQPGDLLYVRETWRRYWVTDPETGEADYNHVITEYAADPYNEVIPMLDGDGHHVYKSDGSEKLIPWRPSIHMPRSAARIWLQVESVRVERLQDISYDDAQAEGIELFRDGFRHYGNPDTATSPYISFESLWQSVYGSESWQANPFVWVISFTVLSTTGMPESATEGQEK